MTRRATGAVFSLLLALISFPGEWGFSQEWARRMFETTEHDFGTVAWGAKAEFRFVLRNIYLEDVRIASVHSNCSCTSVRIEKPLLKTYEQGAIVATFNTRAFLGTKSATITVKFDLPYPAQVQLHTRGTVRSEISLEPGSAEFGTVTKGTTAERTVRIARNGNPSWQVYSASTENPHLAVVLREIKRHGGAVEYELKITLRDSAPAGPLHDHVVLTTNDRQWRQVVVPVEAMVEAPVAVNPSSLFLGTVKPGETITRQLVIRANQPFRILRIEADGEGFSFDLTGTDTPKKLHIVRVSFTPGSDVGRILRTIRIETDLGGEASTLAAHAVVPKS